METHPAMLRDIRWRRTGSGLFILAVRVDGSWWVLRLNDFPDHPLYTFFIDSQCIGDIDDLPASWLTKAGGAEPLAAHERQDVLSLMRGLGPYGAEAGMPCDGDWCTCSILTDEYAAREH